MAHRFALSPRQSLRWVQENFGPTKMFTAQACGRASTGLDVRSGGWKTRGGHRLGAMAMSVLGTEARTLKRRCLEEFHGAYGTLVARRDSSGRNSRARRDGLPAWGKKRVSLRTRAIALPALRGLDAGENHAGTLSLSGAVALDDGASSSDLREAGTTLEEARPARVGKRTLYRG